MKPDPIVTIFIAALEALIEAFSTRDYDTLKEIARTLNRSSKPTVRFRIQQIVKELFNKE